MSVKSAVIYAAAADSFPQGVISALADQFEVHCVTGMTSSPGDLETAQLVAVFLSQASDELLQAMLVHCKSSGQPVVAFAENLAADRRVALLQSGIAEVFDTSVDHAELLIRISRVLESSKQSGRISELSGQLDRLSAYFSADVVKMILGQNQINHDYGENLDATVFFLDIRNFTRISEGVEPNLIAALLNRLYTDIMDLILTYKGSVNKIIGDALLATFGCPVRGQRDAQNAVECALAIRDTLQLFNSTRPDYIQEDIAIGMGIATGKVFAGTIGSYRKRDYTVIGDTVNIAARLEGLTKQTRFDLIIDKNTRQALGDSLVVRKLQVSRVRGRTQPMEIYLVEGLKAALEETNSGAILF